MAAAVKEKNEGRAWVPNVVRIRSNLWEQDIRICGGVHSERARARACTVRVLIGSSCSMEEFGPEGRAKRVGMLDRCEVPLFWCGDKLWAVGFHSYPAHSNTVRSFQRAPVLYSYSFAPLGPESPTCSQSRDGPSA